MKNIAVKENHLYNKAYAKGKRFIGKFVRIYVLRDLKAKNVMKANPEKKFVNRIGISVSKKCGIAVVRNRIKRIIREAYRAVEKNSNLRHGNLVIISANKRASEAMSYDIEKELRYGFDKLSMFEEIRIESVNNSGNASEKQI